MMPGIVGIVVYTRQRRHKSIFNNQWMPAQETYVDQKEEYSNLDPILMIERGHETMKCVDIA